MNDNFVFSAKERKFCITFMAVGLILFAVGALLHLDTPQRIWTALLYNNFFFLLLGIAATFFLSAETLGYGGWVILVKRVSEAVNMYVPIGALLMVPILIFGLPSIYEWVNPDLYNPDSPHFDELLAGKQAYLNVPFFYTRVAIYLLGWSLFAYLHRKNSIQMDQSLDLKAYYRSKTISAVHLLFFGVTSSMSAWDILMSIQPHWYSTLFGWYTFISSFVSSMSLTMLFLLYLKDKGHLKLVNDEHIHDVGKFMFAFSVGWGYLFFSQYMLYWYANIPEETAYFNIRRHGNYLPIMYLLVVLNFLTPFLVLMTKSNKRNYKLLMAMACIIIFGHWLDFFQMSMPFVMQHAGGAHEVAQHATEAAHGAAHEASAAAYHVTEYYTILPGFIEFGLLLFYVGLFSFVIFRSLAQTSLVPVNHPFLKESVIHHT